MVTSGKIPKLKCCDKNKDHDSPINSWYKEKHRIASPPQKKS